MMLDNTAVGVPTAKDSIDRGAVSTRGGTAGDSESCLPSHELQNPASPDLLSLDDLLAAFAAEKAEAAFAALQAGLELGILGVYRLSGRWLVALPDGRWVALSDFVVEECARCYLYRPCLALRQ